MHFVRDIRFARDIFAMQKRYVPLERKGACGALNKTGYALREGTETLPYIFLITNRFVGCGAPFSYRRKHQSVKNTHQIYQNKKGK